jgi:acetyltransferase-like isoleucine patch superfamily enzyme
LLLEEKLRRFCNNDLNNAEEILTSDASSRDIAIDPSFSSQCFFEAATQVAGNSFLSSGPPAFIGSNTYMNSGGYFRSNTFIGRYCSIGRRVSIGAGIHNMYGLSTSPAIKGVSSKWYSADEATSILGRVPKRTSKFTIIDSDVWIGDGVVILEGIKIGAGSIIGSNAVVTHDVQPYEIIVGIPGKPIKKRFSVEIVSALLESLWWNYSPNFINSLPTSNVALFLEKLKQNKESNFEDFKTYLVKKK